MHQSKLTQVLRSALAVMLRPCGSAGLPLFIALATFAFAWMGCGEARAATSAFPASSSGISVGLAFDYRATDPSAVAQNVSYVFGGYFLNWNLPAYPAVGHDDAYMPFALDPWPQSAAGHSLANWQATHPDWVVYQCDGRTPAYYGSGNTEVPLDFSNPAVRQWQVQQAAQALASPHVQGMAFDDFTFNNRDNECGVYKNGVWTSLGYVNGADNAKYQSDMLTWLSDVSSQLKQMFPTKTITVNFSPVWGGLANTKAIAPYVDGVFDEGGFTRWGQQNLSGNLWEQEAEGLEYLNSEGKAFTVNGIVNAADDQSVTHSQLNWVLANYLLVKGSYSYTYVYGGNGQGYTGSPSGYGTFLDRPEYHVAIGAPTSARYQAQGVQVRNYAGGLAIVNPSASQTFTVTLPHAYYDMWGQSYTSVTLAPTAGIVLVGSPGNTPGVKAGATAPTTPVSRPPVTTAPVATVAKARPAKPSATSLAAIRRQATTLLRTRSRAVRFPKRNSYRIACVRLRHGAHCAAGWRAHAYVFAASLTRADRYIHGRVTGSWRVRITKRRARGPRH